jgi:hypothetical protein
MVVMENATPVENAYIERVLPRRERLIREVAPLEGRKLNNDVMVKNVFLGVVPATTAE